VNRSIYFPTDLEREILKRAKAKKLSVSQVVCDAVRKSLKRKAKK
jgi:post-segregation antitoxin (ccd killing protein)